MEDETIIDLFLARDESAIRETKEKFGWKLRILALGLLKDVQTAEECENDVYLRAWNSIPPHAPYGYFYQFLTKLTRETALSRLRGRNARKRHAPLRELTEELREVTASDGGVDELMDDMTLKLLLDEFLGELPDEMRNVFIRRYWYFDRVDRIAEGYGMSVSKVKSILLRCRNRLKEFLEGNGYTV